MALALPASVDVLTPATSANLGPGFDSLGLALQLYNRFTVVESGGDPLLPEIDIQGLGSEGLSRGPDNLFFRVFAMLFERQKESLPAVHIRMLNRIPPGCGLGSSATAVVGGLVAANEWLHERGKAVSKEELLEIAVEMEAGNHPDNVAPALLGSLVATIMIDGRARAIKTPFPEALKAIIFTPTFPMDTVMGRKLLPASYPRTDVTFNTGRVALLLSALQTGNYEAIGDAMQDRLHQPYREAMFPAMNSIIQAAKDAGAYGACLSGGGSSLIALASARFSEILRAMQDTARTHSVEGAGMVLRADQMGARVVKTSRTRRRKEVSTRYGNQFYWSPARPGAR